MMTPLQMAEAIMSYCAWSGGSVTSWGRSTARNEQVGGHARSYHLTWQAFDVGYAPNPAPELQAARVMATHLGLELTREDDHDHFEPL